MNIAIHSGNLSGRCVQIFKNGIKAYAERFYNLLDTVALSCYLIAITCKLLVHSKVRFCLSIFIFIHVWFAVKNTL